MFTKFLFLLFTVCGFFAYSQQNEEFRQINDRYSYHRSLILSEFRKEFDTVASESKKAEMRRDFADFMLKMDSVENSAYVATLVRVKNKEDLTRISTTSAHKQEFSKFGAEKDPEYPGGLTALREEVAKGFYSGSLTTDQSRYRSQVSFIVEPDGYVSTVEASGENPSFNRQAIIAVYMLKNRFQPATIAGVPVRYRYQLPIVMEFQ